MKRKVSYASATPIERYIREYQSIVVAIQQAGYPIRKCPRKAAWRVWDGDEEFKVFYSPDGVWNTEGKSKRLREIVKTAISKAKNDEMVA